MRHNGFFPMVGHQPELGLRAGFLGGDAPGGALPPSMPLLTRFNGGGDTETAKALEMIARGERTGTIDEIVALQAQRMTELQRAITSSTSNLPIRENLEAETVKIVPLDTPLRNKLPRKPGAGTAVSWRQQTTLGGGWGVAATSTGSGNTSGQATLTVDNAGGIHAGDVLLIDAASTAEFKTVSSVNYSTNVITLTANLANTQNSKTVAKYLFQPGGGTPIRSFFVETGAPVDHTTAYANKTAAYKLLGTFGSVTGFAMAAGANFQDQLAVEKANSITNLMLNEENALINGSSTIVAAPWGDGTTAMGFDGLLNLVTTANGVPANQVQTSVGALTIAHIDAQLMRLYNQGANDLYMVMNAQEALSLTHLAEANGTYIRLQADNSGKVQLGLYINAYTHPVTGRPVSFLVSRFCAPGTMFFIGEQTPAGQPVLEVEVLPQVQLPQLAPNENIQGYVAQELAPTQTAPQVYAFITSVYEVLKLKSAVHVAVSKGLTAV